MSSKNNILSDEFKDLNNVAFKEKDNYLHAKPYPHITFKKIFNEIGTLEPSKDRMPNEKAISVAEGMAQPFNVSLLPRFITT